MNKWLFPFLLLANAAFAQNFASTIVTSTPSQCTSFAATMNINLISHSGESVSIQRLSSSLQQTVIAEGSVPAGTYGKILIWLSKPFCTDASGRPTYVRFSPDWAAVMTSLVIVPSKLHSQSLHLDLTKLVGSRSIHPALSILPVGCTNGQQVQVYNPRICGSAQGQIQCASSVLMVKQPCI
jgi:hypothetical protein